MDQAVEEQVRALAQPLWESAARPYGMAMDFWLMAEQMVMEMMAASARMSLTMLGEPPAPPKNAPEAVPVAQVRALAQCMWESAGRHYEMAQDFWLAAERHVMAMVRAAGISDASPFVQDLSTLTPSAYLDRIRASAYYLWEAAGRQYGQAMEFWLTAERQTLATFTAAYAPQGTANGAHTTKPVEASEAAEATEAPTSAAPPVVEDAAPPHIVANASTKLDAAAEVQGEPVIERQPAERQTGRKPAARSRSSLNAPGDDRESGRSAGQ